MGANAWGRQKRTRYSTLTHRRASIAKRGRGTRTLNAQPVSVPDPACAALYRGTVMHARMKPVAHRFTYRVFSLLVDIGRLDELARLSPENTQSVG